jgi:hypothetical protein
MNIKLQFSYEEAEDGEVLRARVYTKMHGQPMPDWKGIGGKSHGYLEAEVSAETLIKIVTLIQLQKSN